MKSLFLMLATVLFLTSCDSGEIGKYKKEPLPKGFRHKILEDKSDESLEKNQLTVEINQKITEGQIATLAGKLFDSKPKQRRFFIFIQMKDIEATWATSHFNPDLEINILGSTSQQDEESEAKANEEIDGEVVGKWKLEKYSQSTYIIFKKDNKIFLKIIFTNGQTLDKELKEKKVDKGTRYDHKEGGYNGEYFILNNEGALEFYNSENENFTTAPANK